MKTKLLMLGALASALAVAPALAQGTPNATGSQSPQSALAQSAKPQPQQGATTGQGMSQPPAPPAQQPNNNETGSQSSGSAPAQSSSPK